MARFILEELQLAPWHLTSEFIDVHKNAQGTGMMKLTGLGKYIHISYNIQCDDNAKSSLTFYISCNLCLAMT